MIDAMSAGDWDAARKAEQEKLAAALRIGPNGRIASISALCLALGARRDVYRDVVQRYRDGRSQGKRPREGTITHKMLTALVACGDKRFASRRPGAAA